MSRFNKQSEGTQTVNLAGGQAYSQSPELELVSILLTSFANDAFYESADNSFDRLKALIAKCDKKFVAQAAIYARTQFGMRSITHCVASELAKHIAGEPWAKEFYNAIIYRPDDMMEILSYHTAKNGKIPNSIKKGFAKAFNKFDRYSLAKYRGEGKGFKLIDVVNMCHPEAAEKNEGAIADLIAGKLKSFDTWEVELSAAGQAAESDQAKAAAKKEVWTKLIQEKKLGYFALLRNLRNIIEQAPEVINEAIATLTNEQIIKKSLVLPFRFLTAFFEIQKMEQGKIVRDVLMALNKAVDISLKNIPKFEGETLVVLDVSSSMRCSEDSKSPHVIGSLFAAALAKANNADLMTFDGSARYTNINPMDSTVTIANGIKFNGGSTNFHSIFQTINKAYDRIIILSDMQGWVGYHTPTVIYNQYKNTHSANPFIYSFDLKNYGSMQFPESMVFCIAGFSEKVFDIMKLMEEDKKALINTIKKVVF